LLITIPIMGGKFRAYSPVQFLGSTSVATVKGLREPFRDRILKEAVSL